MQSRDENLCTNEEPNPIQIVGVYAQEDEAFYLQLKKSLHLWERQGHLSWLEMLPGSDRSATLHAFTERADVLLLFLSPDFFPDEYCYEAMRGALQEKVHRSVLVIPLLVRAVQWQTSPCKHLAIIPQNEVPVASWSSLDEAYQCICADLVHLIPAWQLNMPSLPVRPRLFQARDLPNGYIPRPKAFDAIKHLLLNRQGNQTAAITTALRGAGGFGKTTLALALCHDSEIQAAFPDGILWVELGEHPPRPLDVMNGVLASLEPSQSRAITLEETRDRWRKALGSHQYLLVIDDVWQAQALIPLLEGGPRCTRLVTTRNDQVLPEEATRLFVDAMERDEAIAVLCRGLSEEIHHTSFQPIHQALASRLGYWPLLLTLANSMLVAQVRHGRALPAALAMIEQAYEARGVLAFDPGNLTDRQRAVKACIEVSLRHLEEFTTPHYQARGRYQELAVFPEDIDIPLETLRLYWQGTGGLATWEVDDLCMHLHDLSLLLTCDLKTNTIRLHDVLRSYLEQCAGQRLPLLHDRFLDSCWQALSLTSWADVPANASYLWQYLVLHLCKAERLTELQATLINLRYLARKVLYAGISALEADLLLASTTFSRLYSDQHSQVTPSSALPFFPSLYRTIMRRSHLLRQATTLDEVNNVFLNYLSWESPFDAQRSVLEDEQLRPFLTAWYPLPEQSSDALLRTLSGHTEWVNSCAISPDGSWIVSTSCDRTLKVWDSSTGAERFTLTGPVYLDSGCAVSPDGSWIASASGNALKIWDAVTGTEHLTLSGHTELVTGCAISPDGSFIVSASHDKTLKVWDSSTGAERLTLTGHTKQVTGCAVSPDGSWIVSTSYDKTLKVWNSSTGVECFTLKGHKSRVLGCAISPDGSFIVSASSDKTLKIWDAVTGAKRFTLTGHTRRVTGCAVSPDSSFIVSTSWDHTLKVWNASSGVEYFSLSDHADGVTGCAVSPDGSFIVSTSHDRTLKIWDATTEASRRSLAGHTELVSGCAVSPDGSFIVSASYDKTLKIWDTSTGRERLTLNGHTGPVYGCAVSPDSSFIVSASNDGTLKVWDTATGAQRLSFQGHVGDVIGCVVSLDGSRIISAGDHTLRIWDAVTGAEHLMFKGHKSAVNGCAVSPDGSFIVSASSDRTLKVWDSSTGTERLTLKGHKASVRSCAVSPDGGFIVSSSSDHTLKIWNAVTGVQHFTLKGHADSVWSCAVSPDGYWIVSVSHDHTLKIWKSQTGQCVLTLSVAGLLWGCAFHPDGEHLVACGNLGMFFLRLVV